MSLATLKKKTAHKYNNSSKATQFSLNGTHRNQGYIGQTSLSRTLIKSPSYGPIPQGHGGCCHTYNSNTLRPSSVFSTEDNQIVKPSVLGTKGMLQKRIAWSRRPAPFTSTVSSDYLNQKTSFDYLVYKRKKALQECDNIATTQVLDKKCCPIAFKENKNIKSAKTQGDYLLKLVEKCSKLDESYIEHRIQNINGAPVL